MSTIIIFLFYCLRLRHMAANFRAARTKTMAATPYIFSDTNNRTAQITSQSEKQYKQRASRGLRRSIAYSNNHSNVATPTATTRATISNVAKLTIIFLKTNKLNTTYIPWFWKWQCIFLDKNVIKTHLNVIPILKLCIFTGNKRSGSHVFCSCSQKVEGHVTRTQAIEKNRPK